MHATIRKRPDKYLATEIDDELILVHADTGAFFSLAGTGLAIWRALDHSNDPDAIVQSLIDGYDVEHDRCQRSVVRFNNRLVEAGFAEFC
ncbi:MAG: PqqD family protein [Alphaproteobacteria bacterium]|nr:MAG: PqqD family protein [Alphaproteobacteria bacterium]